ncbi:Metallo-dependent phosphatase-like protein [Parachaetomium inaequale]|uniref:Endopolyphosphatase n=1 Tax=Parachaetomium inaequale TaxID=2588326 RepID=A0AAN6SRW4_9PEZI|nr:Metallo-dependent phosphatase-like protein [Parachaetomium inaequale]
MPFRRVLAVALLCHGVIAGRPGPAADETRPARAASAPRKLHGRFLHITDIHPDEFYKLHSSTDEDGACHRGKGPAGPYGAETSDCDSPFSLVNATFDWIDAHLKETIDFVVWTGDSARHDRDEDLPRNADQVLGTNTWIADKFARLFAADDDGAKGMTVPVVPTFGNNDILPHNILLPGPNKWFQHYAHIWRHFIPEEQRHSFEYGGWFHVEVIPDKLAVFSLNTLYFFDRNAGVDGCANPAEPGYKQMEWLKVQLQFLRERGMKAILMGHVPPARTESKMLWDETCWQKYSLWMHQFRDVVVVGLYGHMNIDHFLIHDKDEIDIAALAGSAEFGTREAMDDELSTQSASDYLMELRSDWAKLTPPPTSGKEVNKEGKRRKGKKRSDPWGERYHLSLVGPSVVPNYFPTLRVLEYNITGLEHALLWKDAARKGISHDTEAPQKHLELRHLPDEADIESDPDLDLDLETDDDDDTLDATKKKHKKKKNKKKKPPSKDKKPKDPNLFPPLPPSKSTPPGPAYSPQPLTLTGYTQYFANLTHINNLNLTDPSTDTTNNDGESGLWGWDWDWLLRWRKGKHGGKKPATGGPHSPQPPPPPREFAYEVEYSTFEDAIYRLGDLTVNSFVELAVRMGGEVGKSVGVDGLGGQGDEEEGSEGDDGDDDEGGVESDDGDDDDDTEVGAEKKKKKGKGKKGEGKKGKKRKQNKTWLHFLRHAFVGTLEKDELKNFT